MTDNTPLDTYHEQGYALIPGVFSTAEMDDLEAAFDAIIEHRLRNRAGMEATWEGDWNKEHGQTSIMLTHDVQAYAAAWTRALVHDRLTSILAHCVGSENVQLHHTKLFQKPPEKGSGFPMHQDAPYFPHEKHTMVAAVVYVSDIDEEMGCIRVVPGSHKLGVLPEYHTKAHYLDPKQYPIENGTPAPGRRGDVLVFSYLTIHGSAPNRSDRTRKSVLIQCRAAEDRPTDHSHISHAQGMMLRGVNPLTHGQTAAEGTLTAGNVATAK